MNASTLTRPGTQPTPADAGKQTQREACDQLRKQEADRVFEAGVQWFLAVSRLA